MQELQYSEAFDYLFHGHTHAAADRLAGPTCVINPGALQRVSVPTFVILDLQSGEAETVEVRPCSDLAAPLAAIRANPRDEALGGSREITIP